MSDRMRRRLRRMGVVKGTRELRVPPVRPSRPVAAEPARAADESEPAELGSLLPNGALTENALGAYYVVDHVAPVSAAHGVAPLGALLQRDPTCLAPLLGCESESLDNALFLDTETTGLAGAGTLAFMVGVGFFADDAFVVRQYFLRDHGDEAAMLHDLAALAQSRRTLVTFNGRTFDVPLLNQRYLMNRMLTPLEALPQLDLLTAARRLWRHRLGSVALSALEPALLGVRRGGDDVPGWLIPTLYHDYLRSGDARPLAGVFYHNRIDILSMVTLADRVLDLVSAPESWTHAADLYGLARWRLAQGDAPAAERLLRQAIDAGDLPLPLWRQALHLLGTLLKRREAYDEALVVWQQLAFTAETDVAAHIELAKHFEWREGNLEQAYQWTLRALEMLPPGRSPQRDAVAHRRRRLERKRTPH